MPIHEFQCPKCGHTFEELVFGDEKATCPKCGCAETEQLMSVCRVSGCGCSDGGASGGHHGGGCSCGSCSGGNCSSCCH